MLRFGIIGTGGIADNAHAPALQALADVALTAVLSRDAQRGQDFLARHQAVRATAHTSLQAFAADPNIDAVIITSPDKLHAAQAIACLRAGKHVMVEKPMATSGADAAAMVQQAQQAGKMLAVGFHLRQHAGHQLLRRLLQQGQIGTLQHLRAIWAFPAADNSNWRAHDDVGQWWSLAAVGSHAIDLTRWLANGFAPFATCRAVIDKTRWGGPHDETAIIAGQLVSGVTFEVTSSVKYGPYSRLEAFGDKGFLVASETFGRHGAGKITLNAVLQDFTPVNPFVAQLQAFVASIKNGRPPENDGVVGLCSVHDLLEATTQSAGA